MKLLDKISQINLTLRSASHIDYKLNNHVSDILLRLRYYEDANVFATELKKRIEKLFFGEIAETIFEELKFGLTNQIYVNFFNSFLIELFDYSMKRVVFLINETDHLEEIWEEPEELVDRILKEIKYTALTRLEMELEEKSKILI